MSGESSMKYLSSLRLECNKNQSINQSIWSKIWGQTLLCYLTDKELFILRYNFLVSKFKVTTINMQNKNICVERLSNFKIFQFFSYTFMKILVTVVSWDFFPTAKSGNAAVCSNCLKNCFANNTDLDPLRRRKRLS